MSQISGGVVAEAPAKLIPRHHMCDQAVAHGRRVLVGFRLKRQLTRARVTYSFLIDSLRYLQLISCQFFHSILIGKMSSPVSPSLKDLPKVNTDLKSQLECFNQRNLKDVNTLEKIVLPSAEDVAAEKTQRALLEGVEAFDTSKLKHTETQEKNLLPDKDVVYQEKVHQKLFDGVEHFDKKTMKHAETQEKNPLPDREVIELEKDKMKFITGIESFDPSKLKHTETLEKNPLPTKEIIDQEKKA